MLGRGTPPFETGGPPPGEGELLGEVDFLEVICARAHARVRHRSDLKLSCEEHSKGGGTYGCHFGGETGRHFERTGAGPDGPSNALPERG